MIALLNCDECKMQYHCTHIPGGCKYPEGRQYGVTTYDKMRADERSALEKRLEEAERVIECLQTFTYSIKLAEPSPSVCGCADFILRTIDDYHAKYPKGGE